MAFAKNIGKQAGILEQMKFALWNVRGMNHKYYELQNELLNIEVDIGMIWEAKKKLKSMGELEYYCLIYSGVVQEQQATACVAIMFNMDWPYFLETNTGWGLCNILYSWKRW